MQNLKRLVEELIKYPNETPWLEFKHNNYEPKMIGTDISALANSAALHDKNSAYMLWGIDDKTHEIVGTEYDLQSLKKGDQELESWLRLLLSKNTEFEFHTVEMNNNKVGILIIYRAANQTVTFEKVDYIRVGSYTKKLNEFPVLQAQLWDKIVASCEVWKLPAPKIDVYEENTKVTLYSEKAFSDLTSDEKLWACYLHACIKNVQSEFLTNRSLRARFGLKESYSGSVSRLIKEAVEKGFLKPLDANTAPRYMKYMPIWA